jgi:uncharacterized membrane protein
MKLTTKIILAIGTVALGFAFVADNSDKRKKLEVGFEGEALIMDMPEIVDKYTCKRTQDKYVEEISNGVGERIEGHKYGGVVTEYDDRTVEEVYYDIVGNIFITRCTQYK